MNRKLKKYTEKQMAQYRNEEFLEKLKSRQREKTNQHHFYNKKFVSLFVSLSAVLVTATVVLLCVFLIKPAATDSDVGPQAPLQSEPVIEEPTNEISPKKYLGGSQIVDSNLNEVNDALNYFSFATGGRIKKHTDEQYNETLYYFLTYTSEDELSTFEFKICVNPDYKLDEMDEEYDREGVVASREIKFSETVNCEDGIYFFTESGRITTDREIILINAEIIGFEENSNFIELLNQIIQEK